MATQANLQSVFQASLPFWCDMTDSERDNLVAVSKLKTYKRGTIINNSTDKSGPGVQIVTRGRTRAYISSPDGKQLTLQRIKDNEIYILGVSCVLDNSIFDVSLETETECAVALIPRAACKRLFDTNIAVKNGIISMIASRFSQAMHTLESVAFVSTGSRLANALIEQSVLAGSLTFATTHAKIAADIGSAREVVTRLLNQFQRNGVLTLTRGMIRINDIQAISDMRGRGFWQYYHLNTPLAAVQENAVN